MGKEDNIFRSLPQGRQVKSNHIESKEKITSEFTLLNGLFQIQLVAAIILAETLTGFVPPIL